MERHFRKEDAFFVLDSEHLDEVKDAFYGFAFNGSRVAGSVPATGEEPDPDGAWVYIWRTENRIRITQDFLGSFGLYLFRKDGYFALSNSFLMLAEYLGGKEKLTLNREYADYFLFADVCSSSMTETPAREIALLDRGAEVTIDPVSKALDIRIRDYEENTVDPGTEEGLAILDAWRQRWTARALQAMQTDGSIQADLSGGFDSRMTMALLLSGGADMDRVYVFSKQGTVHTYADDYRIATEIAAHYGFELNNKKNRDHRIIPFSPEDMLAESLYAKLGFHKQMYYKTGKHIRPWDVFDGKGGACVRGYWDYSEQQYIDNNLQFAKIFDGLPAPERERIRASGAGVMRRTFEALREKYRLLGRTLPEGKEAQSLYREARGRNHFGKSRVESYYSANMSFSPLLDPQLQRLRLQSALCEDPNFLTALVFSRYEPGLLRFGFQGGRSIDPQTLEKAAELNRRYPFAPQPIAPEQDAERDGEEAGAEAGETIITKSRMDAVMFTAFRSPAFRKLFEKAYSKAVYDAIARDAAGRKHQPLSTVNAALAIGLVLWTGLPAEEKDESYIRFLLKNADLSATEATLTEPQDAPRLSLRNRIGRICRRMAAR